jgi:hypothetical protein
VIASRTFSVSVARGDIGCPETSTVTFPRSPTRPSAPMYRGMITVGNRHSHAPSASQRSFWSSSISHSTSVCGGTLPISCVKTLDRSCSSRAALRPSTIARSNRSRAAARRSTSPTMRFSPTTNV